MSTSFKVVDRIGRHDISKCDAPSACPTCGKKLNGATKIDGKGGPRPGDISVCFYCTSFLVFGDDLELALMTADEIVELPAEQRRRLIVLRGQIKESRSPS